MSLNTRIVRGEVVTQPRISVCIPTYKGAATIGPAIASVLAQSFADFELVVIDDGSPDDTPAVVNSFQDSRIRYLRNAANLGPEGNWNRCLGEARGEYFKLLPHDDLLHPDCLARQIAVLDADNICQIALVFSARDVLGPDGRKVTTRGYPGGHEGKIPAREVIRSCIRRGTNLLGEPGAVLMRTRLARLVGPFDATNPYVIDLDFWFRLLSHGDAYFCDAALASFRVSAHSWSFRIGQSQDAEFIAFVQRATQLLNPPVSAFDLLLARLSARLNMWMRLVFYKLYLR
jgi:glycosyltransferase involved in cell wall biosynthesis